MAEEAQAVEGCPLIGEGLRFSGFRQPSGRKDAPDGSLQDPVRGLPAFHYLATTHGQARGTLPEGRSHLGESSFGHAAQCVAVDDPQPALGGFGDQSRVEQTP